MCDATIEFRERLAERLFEDHIPDVPEATPVFLKKGFAPCDD